MTRRPWQVSTFVVSALDGYNVSLFAYGQTGSGKTHTVLGGADEEQWGIVPRAVNLILSTVAEKARAQPALLSPPLFSFLFTNFWTAAVATPARSVLPRQHAP